MSLLNKALPQDGKSPILLFLTSMQGLAYQSNLLPKHLPKLSSQQPDIFSHFLSYTKTTIESNKEKDAQESTKALIIAY